MWRAYPSGNNIFYISIKTKRIITVLTAYLYIFICVIWLSPRFRLVYITRCFPSRVLLFLFRLIRRYIPIHYYFVSINAYYNCKMYWFLFPSKILPRTQLFQIEKPTFRKYIWLERMICIICSRFVRDLGNT